MAAAARSRKVGYGLDQRRRDGAGDLRRQQDPHRGADRQGRAGRRPGAGRWPRRQRSPDSRTVTSSSPPSWTTFRPRRDRAHRNLRPGAQPDARRHHRASHRPGERAQLRQHGLPLHQRRRQRPPLPLRSERRQCRASTSASPRPWPIFPFSGWGESFFGDLHAQAEHGVEFYTQTKVVVERWPRDWSRRASDPPSEINCRYAHPSTDYQS